MTLINRRSALAAGLLLLLGHIAQANNNPEKKEWSFSIAPYAWLAATGGTIVTDGVETEFDLSFDEILELTTGGFQILAEARYGRFFLGFDGTWAQLGHGEDLLGGRIDFSVKQTITELHGGYRIFGPEFRSASPETRSYISGAVALDAYRYSLLAHRSFAECRSAWLAASDTANTNRSQWYR